MVFVYSMLHTVDEMSLLLLFWKHKVVYDRFFLSLIDMIYAQLKCWLILENLFLLCCLDAFTTNKMAFVCCISEIYQTAC